VTSIKRILENWHFTWDDVQLNIPEGKELCLDMGCGDGRHRYLIEKAGWHWIGLDIDAERGGGWTKAWR